MKLKADQQIDEMIRKALTEEEGELYDRLLDEPTVLELVTGAFSGRMRHLTALAIVMGIVLMAVSVYSLTRFSAAPDVPAMLRWGALMFFGILGIAAMKIWHWMEMQRHALTREIRRLELQVASLAARSAGEPA